MRSVLLSFLLIALLISASATEDGWPMWMADGGSAANGQPPSDRQGPLPRPRPAWTSEARFGGARGPDGRRGRPDRRTGAIQSSETPSGAGHASPIAINGKIFMYHSRPSGDVFCKSIARSWEASNEDLVAKRQARNDNLIMGHDRWQVSATDVLTCIDAATGRTIWQSDLGHEALNFNIGVKSGGGVTPAYHRGQVYVLGTGGHLYCVSADNGQVRWTADIGERALMQRYYREQAMTWYGPAPHFRSDFLSAVVAADGVVVVCDHMRHRVALGGHSADFHYERNSGVMAFDAATGRRLWHQPGLGGNKAPTIWRHADKAYVIATGNQETHLIDLRSGDILWRAPFGHSATSLRVSPAAAGPYLVVNQSQADGTYLAVYRLGLDQAQAVWSVPGTPTGNVTIVGDHLYAIWDGALTCFELATGQEVFRQEHRTSGNAFLLAYNGLLIASGRGGITVMPADPQHGGQPAHAIQIPLTRGYDSVVMPAFTNGMMFVRTDNWTIEAFHIGF